MGNAVGTAFAMMAALTFGAAETLRAQIVQVPEVAVEVRRDSATDALERVTSLKLPSQRPWQNTFFVNVRVLPPGSLDSFDLEVGFDLKMGPQILSGPDGEVLDKKAADRLGAWFRTKKLETKQISCSPTCPRQVQFGPFALDDLIPGPRGPDATLWPVRLRVHAQAIAARSTKPPSDTRSSAMKAVTVKELLIQ